MKAKRACPLENLKVAFMVATTMWFLIPTTLIGTVEPSDEVPFRKDNLPRKDTVLGPFPIALVHVKPLTSMREKAEKCGCKRLHLTLKHLFVYLLESCLCVGQTCCCHVCGYSLVCHSVL